MPKHLLKPSPKSRTMRQLYAAIILILLPLAGATDIRFEPGVNQETFWNAYEQLRPEYLEKTQLIIIKNYVSQKWQAYATYYGGGRIDIYQNSYDPERLPTLLAHETAHLWLEAQHQNIYNYAENEARAENLTHKILLSNPDEGMS